MARVRRHTRPQSGFTLVEVLLGAVLGALLLAALGAATGLVARATQQGGETEDLQRDAAFALQRIAAAVLDTNLLLIPQRDNLATTARDESVRDVLAVALSPTLDRDWDGFADADNDHDGKVDEDWGSDMSNDGVAGIIGLDFNGDGVANNGANLKDDDEDGVFDEDARDGVDNDADGNADEDYPAKMAGGAGSADDDGDGLDNEDWLDVVAFYIKTGKLYERMPNLNPTSGADYTERVIADNATAFQVQRVAPASGERAVSLVITLTLTGKSGISVTRSQRLRVGGAR